MTKYTPEFEAMRVRWLRSLLVPGLLLALGIWLFSRWGVLHVPTLPWHLPFVQSVMDVLPLLLIFGGFVGIIVQTFRLYRCPECGTPIELGNKGACQSCGTSFGFSS